MDLKLLFKGINRVDRFQSLGLTISKVLNGAKFSKNNLTDRNISKPNHLHA